jgi:hypothetical protein
MDQCHECGNPADLYGKRDGCFVPWCRRCRAKERHNRLIEELTNRVLACADCGTTRATRWFRIIQGQWHCETCRGDRHFVTILGYWRPFGEPGDGTLFQGQ